MAGTPVWNDLAKDALDSTTIGQEIAAQITDHNDDADAHLGDGQALESHRAAEIIDHLAESVVNDKIQSFARSYVALVGTGVDGDFDTVQSAIAYAAGIGGGTIFIAPGEYYLSGAVSLPISINITSADSETVIIHGGYTGGNYFKTVDDTANGQISQAFSNINFVNDGGGVFHSTTSDLTYLSTQLFGNCAFSGGGQYIYAENLNITMSNCAFAISDVVAISTLNTFTISDSVVSRYSTSSTCYFFEFNGGDAYSNTFIANRLVLDCTGATTCEYFTGSGEGFFDLSFCRIYSWACNGISALWKNLFNCYCTFKTNHDLSFGTDGNDGVIALSYLIFSGTGNLVVPASAISLDGNLITGTYSGVDETISVYADRGVQSYYSMQPGYTACDFGTTYAVQISPNSTRTMTTTVPRAGERRSFIVLTSGTTSYTLTFGTGFKTTGTLVTGTTSARRFIISFVSDGTYLIEASRTVAIA